MKLILLASILFSFSSFGNTKSCKIDSFEKIYYLPNPNGFNSKEIIKRSDCPLDVKRKFNRQIYKSSGSLTSNIINSISEIKNSGYTVELTPNRIQVINLKNEFQKQFNLRKDWTFGKLKMLNKKSAIGLDLESSLSLSCELCHTTGEKNIALEVRNPIKGFSKTHWVQGTVFISTKALIPVRSLSASEPQLSPSLFKKELINVTRPEQYFTNIEQLVFYKLNKSLPEGTGLKFTDLTPINLVSAGIPTKVVLKSGGLVLNGTGIPSQSGKFGEIIKLRNPKTKRMIIGKVVDFNKVLVDL
ncbi:MAG: flagella basal body P-ring formation protein FlgA [Halobacteriovorax sp.]|nr:flagella basal body P-ring formation protein FlgA [Halobacteriovorax sp.]